MAKMDKKWIMLCTTAVAAVYATGYFSTEAQATKMNFQPQSAQVNIHKSANQAGSAAAQVSIQKSANQAGRPVAKVIQSNKVYKDGTFTGTGWNRRGQIEVAVTLKSDKITDVEIKNWGMHYSEQDVTPLPGEVLQKQNAQVNNVSGATYSTQAFADAVQDALNQAHIA
jgi:uncharacterized protein with FMN-binding domain